MENAGKEDMPDEAERKGLGTPATRAAILEKLVAAGFVERKGKSLIPTKAGINLVTVLPDTLTSPMLTAEWEQKLTAIARGEGDPAAFMAGISDMARELVKTYSLKIMIHIDHILLIQIMQKQLIQNIQIKLILVNMALNLLNILSVVILNMILMLSVVHCKY